MRLPRRAVGPEYRPTHEVPRLLTLTPDFPPSLGGIQLYLQRLVEHLPGWDHRVLARGPASASDGVRRTWLTRGAMSNLELNLRALPVAARWRPDVVLCAHVVTAPAAATMARLGGVPVVFIGYADELTHRPRLTHLAARHATASVAISGYTADLLRAAAPVGAVHRILPGFDQRPAPGARSPGPPRIVTVARLTDRYKGHDVMLEALFEVRRVVPDVCWLIVGDGPLRGELEARVHELGVVDAVRFLGRVDDVERDRLLAQARVFAMPSRLPERGAGGEGFGIVYLEAAAAGTPVVAGRVAGALDAVAHGETGLLVDPTSHEAVGAALTTLLTDDAAWSRMSAAAPGWASRFSWDRMASEIDAVLREALHRPQQSLDRLDT